MDITYTVINMFLLLLLRPLYILIKPCIKLSQYVHCNRDLNINEHMFTLGLMCCWGAFECDWIL